MAGLLPLARRPPCRGLRRSPLPPSPPAPQITDAALGALGTFLKAAENLEALKWWAATFAVNHPQLYMDRMVQVGPLAEEGRVQG